MLETSSPNETFIYSQAKIIWYGKYAIRIAAVHSIAANRPPIDEKLYICVIERMELAEKDGRTPQSFKYSFQHEWKDRERKGDSGRLERRRGRQRRKIDLEKNKQFRNCNNCRDCIDENVEMTKYYVLSMIAAFSCGSNCATQNYILIYC